MNGVKLLKATGMIVGSLAAFFLFLGWAITLPQTGLRGIGLMVAIVFFLATVLVVKTRKARDQREREHQPPVPTATIVREDLEIPDAILEERPRERELE